MKFNENFNDRGEKAQFIFRKDELLAHTWRVFEFREGKKSYEPIGEYTVLDLDEPVEITEKKVMNLISIMNGKQRLIDFTNLTKTRILYNIVPKNPDSEQQKVIFRTYDGSGVSKENAVLTLEKGVFDED